MEVSVVTWLVTKMIQLKLRPKIPVPTAPKCACLQEALWGTFRADKLAWDFGVRQLGPAWKLEQQDPASGGSLPHAPRRWGPLFVPCQAQGSTGQVEAGRPQAVVGRPLAGPGARVLVMTLFSYGGSSQSRLSPRCSQLPGLRLRKTSSSRLCNGEWVM